MQSLAEALGTTNDKAQAGPSLLTAQPATAEEFAEAFLSSIEFRQYLVNALTLGELPAAVILRMMDYAKHWGKPVERVEIDDRRESFETMSKEQIVQRIAQLQALVQELPEDNPTDTVH